MTESQKSGANIQIAVLPLKGELCAQYISCRKPECKCADGDLHGPYYYRIWRDGAKVNKAYVKRSEVDDVRAACATYKTLMAALKDHRHAREDMTRQLSRDWRETKKMLKPQRRHVKLSMPEDLK